MAFRPRVFATYRDTETGMLVREELTGSKDRVCVKIWFLPDRTKITLQGYPHILTLHYLGEDRVLHDHGVVFRKVFDLFKLR